MRWSQMVFWQHKRDIEYAYKIAGEPILATKKTK